MQNKFNKKTLLFLFILFVAFYLRLFGVKNGLPYIVNPHESDYIVKIFYLVNHFLNPHYATVPGLFLYLNALLVFIFTGSFDVANLLESNLSNVLVPLRILSVLFGVGSVLLLFFIGNFFNLYVALLSSAFLAVSLIHVVFSQVFEGFSAMLFFSLLVLLILLKAFTTKNFALLRLATLFASLSSSMHYIGFVSLVPVFFVLALAKNPLKLKSLFLLFFISFLLFNPYFVFYSLSLLKLLIYNYIQGYYYYKSSSSLLCLFNFLLIGIGPVVWTSTFGLLKYKNEYDLNLLKITFSLPLFYLGLLGFLHLTNIGYAVLLTPFFCLASALVINSLIPILLEQGTHTQRFIFILLIVFAIYIPFKYVSKFNKLMGLSDTRALASEWIRLNTSHGYKIVWDKNSLQLNWYDPHDLKDLSLLVDDINVLKNKRRFNITKEFLEKKNWFNILRKKVDYVVTNSLDTERVFRRPNKSLEKKFYSKIAKLEPAIIFNPYLLEQEKKIRSLPVQDLCFPFITLWQRERAGPVIKICKL